MRHRDLPTMGDVKGAFALHSALLVVLNYAQLLSKSSPRSYEARIPAVIRTLEVAISALQAWAPGARK